MEDKIDFNGKVAVVTGAGAGLGKAYALEFAKRGAKVVVNDLGGARDGLGESKTPAEAVVSEIKALGFEAVANYDNVATKEGGENIVKTAMESFGSIDILVNNAGILRDKSFTKMEKDNWDAVLDVHLNGAYNVTKPAFAHMKENGFGRIIMTTSAAGLYGNFGQTNYSAAKMGLIGFMNTLKIEGLKYNVHVNTIAPIAASRLTEDILPPEMLEKMKPEFIAPIVMYLSSENCGETGQIYNAGMGFYNRASVITSPSILLGEDGNPPSAETIMENMDRISDMDGAKEFTDLGGAVLDLMTPKAD